MSDDLISEIISSTFGKDDTILISGKFGDEHGDDLSRALVETNGHKTHFHPGPNPVIVTAPALKVFNNKSESAFGDDERFFFEQRDDSFNLAALESMLLTFKERTISLSDILNGRVNTSYPYMAYDPDNHSLTGILLVSKAIAPSIRGEAERFFEHILYKGPETMARIADDGKGKLSRTLLTDLVKDEIDRTRRQVDFDEQEESHYVSMPTLDFYDPNDVKVAPRQHVARLHEMTDEQIRFFAEAIYHAIHQVHQKTRGRGDTEKVYAAIHSAPKAILDSKLLQTHLRGLPISTEDVFGMSFTAHAEIGARTPSSYGHPFPIPFAGWYVVAQKTR